MLGKPRGSERSFDHSTFSKNYKRVLSADVDKLFFAEVFDYSRKELLSWAQGFGGLTFCQTFNHCTARVMLLNHQNHHLFQPLLCQVATANPLRAGVAVQS